MMNNIDDKKGPAVKLPPPLICISVLFAAYAIHQLLPTGLGISQNARYLGLLLSAIALLVLLLCALSFLRTKTSIEPWKPTTSIITTGLYAWSRNPIYTAFCLLIIGCGIFMNSFWILISFLPAASLLYHTAIKKEEAYLETKFGEHYLDYKRKVRRWL